LVLAKPIYDVEPTELLVPVENSHDITLGEWILLCWADAYY